VSLPEWSVLGVALDTLEQHELKGQHERRLELARRMLEMYPESEALHVHHVLAILEIHGLEAACVALRDASSGWLGRGVRLPDTLLIAHRVLDLRQKMESATDLTLKSVVVEIRLEPSGLYRVVYDDGQILYTTASVLMKLHGIRLDQSKVVH
jgi:hypothetical protein